RTRVTAVKERMSQASQKRLLDGYYFYEEIEARKRRVEDAQATALALALGDTAQQPSEAERAAMSSDEPAGHQLSTLTQRARQLKIKLPAGPDEPITKLYYLNEEPHVIL